MVLGLRVLGQGLTIDFTTIQTKYILHSSARLRTHGGSPDRNNETALAIASSAVQWT